MNALALLAGLATYAVAGTVCGFMSLGVGFMPEPSRTIGAYAIVFSPFVPVGLVVSLLARSKPELLAAAVALAAFALFLALAPGPMPFLFQSRTERWVPYAQGAFQAVLSLSVCVISAWCGAGLRSARVRSIPFKRTPDGAA